MVVSSLASFRRLGPNTNDPKLALERLGPNLQGLCQDSTWLPLNFVQIERPSSWILKCFRFGRPHPGYVSQAYPSHNTMLAAYLYTTMQQPNNAGDVRALDSGAARACTLLSLCRPACRTSSSSRSRLRCSAPSHTRLALIPKGKKAGILRRG